MTYSYNRIPLRATLLAICMAFLFAPRLSAQFTITENFKGSSVGGNIILGGKGAGQESAYLTSDNSYGSGDPLNEGWLRLTEAKGNRAGYAYINNTFPSSLGVYIEFEYKAWRDVADNGYNGADGFSVFLFDALTPFHIGGYGGSLGYAYHSSGNQQGLSGAYIGIGIDEYGNFARHEDGRTGGVADNVLQPNSITLRGPASTNWKYLTHKQLQTSSTTDGPNSVDYNLTTASRPNDVTFYRRVKVYFEPIGTVASPKYRIRVLWRTSPTGTDIQHISYETTDAIPPLLKLGFAASTGGGFNYHEIRNLLITTPGGVRVQKEVDKENATIGQTLTYTVNVHNETTAALANLVLTDTLKNGSNHPVSLSDDFQITSITFNNNGNTGNTASGYPSGTAVTSGFANPFSTTMAMAASSSASFTIVGTVKKLPEGGVLKNSVKIDPSKSGITDADATNNYATVSTNVLNPNVDLKIEKGVDNNGIARLSGNIYTITVNNVSASPKPDSKEVKVTDVIPDGFTVTNYTGKSGGLAGNGWTASHAGNAYTFTRSGALASNSGYPPIIINVTPSGTGPWVNTADLDYPDDTNTANNTASVSLRWKNYWRGTTDTDWAKNANWTANVVPGMGEDVEFATTANNGPSGEGNGTGAAQKDLYLDNLNQNGSGGRVIGNLINASDKNLVITTGNQLTINGEVKDDPAVAGTIIVKADPADVNPGGTLKFADPSKNKNVGATVEFYNKAYDCETCGFYTRSWQYFGIPVKSGAFPVNDVAGDETVNLWSEPVNGNKWITAPSPLQAFKGYEITNSSKTQPVGVYRFAGTLNVGDTLVALTWTANVNYPGSNLIGNSYAAAIPISEDALTFPEGVEKTVYLFNTGTRDEWRKLNGTAINQNGYKSGQYLAVPVNLGGTNHFPDRIPSMHAFMLQAGSGNGGNLGIHYNKLVKNEKVKLGDGATMIVTRSAGGEDEASPASSIPFLIMDVIGRESADRVWIFANEDATYGFDNGWDGRKMAEGGIAQLYVSGTDEGRFQVATVPDFNNVSLGFEPGEEGKYTLEFSVSPQLKGGGVYLVDMLTGAKQQIANGVSYVFEARNGDPANRFRLTRSGAVASTGNETLLFVEALADGKLKISNGSSKNCSAFISDRAGKVLQRMEVPANGEMSSGVLPKGMYLVRLQNAEVNDVRRIEVK